MKNKIQDGGIIYKIYLTAAIIIFIAVKITEFTLQIQTVRIIRYSEIVLNTVMAIWIYISYGRFKSQSRENLIALALLITCGADFFLTLNGGGTMFTPGVTLFCIVETVYMIYLNPDKINLLFRAVLLILLTLIAWRLGLLTIGILLGVLNISLLTANMFAAWVIARREKDKPSLLRTIQNTQDKPSLLFAIGMTLFLICDINVGLEVIFPEGTAIYTAAYFTVWTVYIPAQVLIVTTYYKKIRA